METKFELKSSRMYKMPIENLINFINDNEIKQKDIQVILEDRDFITIYYWVLKDEKSI